MQKTYIRAGQNFSKLVTPSQSIALGSSGSNLGNMLFQNAVWKQLESIGQVPVAIGHDLYEQQHKKINNDGKMLILPLANSFRLESKKSLEKYTKLINKLKVPVVVVGVGCQTDMNFNTDKLKPIDKTVKEFVSAVLDRSATIGVRGECTYNYLRRLGFTDVEVIGCPSMYSYGDYLPDIKPLPNFTEDTKIAVSISSKSKQCEFSSGLDWVGELVERICREYTGTTYIPQEQRSLERIIYGSQKKGIEHDIISNDLFEFLVEQRQVVTFTEPISWINHLKKMDLCIGSRIHGNIAGILAGTPSVVMAHDSRTLELSQHHELPYIATSSKLTNTNVAEACALIDFDKTKKVYKKNYEGYRSFLQRNGVIVKKSDLVSLSPFDQELVASPMIHGEQYKIGTLENELFVKVHRYKIRQLRKYGYFNF